MEAYDNSFNSNHNLQDTFKLLKDMELNLISRWLL